jgi:hypothetical protein
VCICSRESKDSILTFVRGIFVNSMMNQQMHKYHHTVNKDHSMNFKIIEVQQAKICNNYKNTKLKLLKPNAAIWFKFVHVLVYHTRVRIGLIHTEVI